ncbi:alpha/beta hydrolase [Nonomuraea sp. NPDC050643]|uniref:alpha/beta hydrolase n=1 Tax=Nonomuraea sp. NPDC050643 TaxID=3155660 RepID=UPI0033C688CE
MSLDEATTRFLQQLAEAGGKPLHEMTPEEARALTAALSDLYGKGPDMAQVDEVRIEGEDGGTFPARVLTPSPSPRAVIVYYHGGGWVIGGLDEFDTLARELAHRTGCAVVLVDYRLAPEHRHPVAARDAYAALLWAAAALPDLPIIVAGDSAGGNLSAVVTQRARDEGGPAITLQVLVYPVTDCDLDNASYTDPANQLMLSRDTMIWFWDHYAPDPARRTSPDASPLRAADLSGLPPAVVLTAEHDVLRDEGEAYAERLRTAGVPVEFRRFDGQMHAFFTMVNVLPGSAAALDLITGAVDGSLR